MLCLLLTCTPGPKSLVQATVDAPLTIEQEVWLATLSHVTQTQTYLWTPDAMGRIREVLC